MIFTEKPEIFILIVLLTELKGKQVEKKARQDQLPFLSIPMSRL
jgi:hypothetical protein